MKWIANHRMALLGAAVSAAYWPGMLSAAFVPRWCVIAIGLPLVSSLDPRNLGEPMRWLLLWLVALGAVSIIASPDRLTGWLDLFFIILLCGTFLVGAGLDSLDDAMTGLGVGLALSSAFAIAQWLGYQPVVEAGSPYPSGLFFNSEVLAEFSAIIFVWAASRPRWAIAFMAAIPIALCHSRVAILASLIGLFYIYRPQSKWASVALIASFAALAVATAFAFGMAKAGTFEQRITIWGATLMAFTPMGNGLGWFQAAHPGEQYAHSDAIQFLVEIGIGAFLAIVIPVVAFFKRRGNDAERAAFVAICFEILVSFPLHVPAGAFVAALVAGYLVSGRARDGVGLHHGKLENGRRDGRSDAAGGRVAIRGYGGRRAFSVRSIFARAAAHGAPADWQHSKGTA